MAVGSRYRLLAVDLDGTLISLDLRLDPRDVDGVRRAEAAGLRVVACTGRPNSFISATAVCGSTTTFAPSATRPKRSITFAFVMRMQPLETCLPIEDGSLASPVGVASSALPARFTLVGARNACPCVR